MLTVLSLSSFKPLCDLSQLSAAKLFSQLLNYSTKLLEDFPDVLSSDGFTTSKPRHGVRHHLLTNPGPPVFAKPRRLDPEKLAAAKDAFSAIEKAGIIQRSTSPR